ncbi:MAG: hypothetical protein RBS49_02860 [Sphaerochaeta sp.]|jgi:hypothetical protein|nr:hypothetical protein [Sphaerochaeta sp.]MDX9914807.1 hypothetical protein [Sphaerochaeta sp.]
MATCFIGFTILIGGFLLSLAYRWWPIGGHQPPEHIELPYAVVEDRLAPIHRQEVLVAPTAAKEASPRAPVEPSRAMKVQAT